MPFTFSHPAAILPLTAAKRRLFSATGLIIGSMTPDFEYFIRLQSHSAYSHSFSGILWFDLPLGLILCFIYHGIVRQPPIENAPLFAKSRLSRYNRFNWSNYFSAHVLTVLISLVIGALSHVIWDGFTHQSGWFVVNADSFNRIKRIGPMTLPVYRWLEHASTVIGGFIVFVAFMRLKKFPVPESGADYRYWLMVAFIMLLIPALKIFSGLKVRHYETLVVTALSGMLAAIILTPLLLKLFTRTKSSSWKTCM